jgi:hypothetical protein
MKYKGGNVNKKTHWDLKKTRDKEESRAQAGDFEEDLVRIHNKVHKSEKYGVVEGRSPQSSV